MHGIKAFIISIYVYVKIILGDSLNNKKGIIKKITIGCLFLLMIVVLGNVCHFEEWKKLQQEWLGLKC